MTEQNMRGTVVLLSGGMDSCVLLAKTVNECDADNVVALSVDYGQRHWVELEAARAIALHYEVEHIVVPLGALVTGVFTGNQSSQLNPSVEVPHGHYADDTMRATVVPNRNMILLSLATAAAVSRRYAAVAYAAHAGDHAVYPDCRRVFADSMADAMQLCDYDAIQLRRPFIGMSKAEVCRLGADLAAPLGLSYSCYEGGPQHCGKCGTCVERKEAFADAGVDDPTDYA